MPDRSAKLPVPGQAPGSVVVKLSQLAALMRPELPGLAREIIAEIRGRVPEYARPMDGPYGEALRSGVQQALMSFFDSLIDPSAPHERRDHVCRRLGQMEALEGRSLDSLQSAYRIGVHVAWRKLMEVGLAHGAPSPVMSQLADVVLAYMDELATLSREGYLEAKARSQRSREEWRRRLLQLILERPQAPMQAILELAALTGWAVPEEVTLVALDPGPGCAAGTGTIPGAGSFPGPAEPDALADLSAAQPHVLLPGRLDPARKAALEEALASQRGAVGLTVTLADAAHSLRWARRTLELSRAGIIGDGPVTYCEEHMLALWLLSDEALVSQLAQQQFGPLAGFTPAQRQRLTETCGTWLETRGTAAEMAGKLNVHPQTVRYRMRKLSQALGAPLNDPDARFTMEAVLRATRLKERGEAG